MILEQTYQQNITYAAKAECLVYSLKKLANEAVCYVYKCTQEGEKAWQVMWLRHVVSKIVSKPRWFCLI